VVCAMPIARQLRGKHAFATVVEAVFSVGRPPDYISSPVVYPRGGGIEYLHRDPASRRR
jgi:hypothetical protein